MTVNLRNKILPLLAKKDWSVDKYAEMCEISGNGMHGILKNNDTKVSTLIKMASVLDIDVREFFEPEEDINEVGEPHVPYGKNRHAEYLLDKLMEAESKIKRLENENSKNQHEG